MKKTLRADRLRRLRRHRRDGLFRSSSSYSPRPPRCLRPSSARARGRLRRRLGVIHTWPWPRRRLECVAHGRRGPFLARRPQRRARRERRRRGRSHVVAPRRVVGPALGAAAGAWHGARQRHEAARAAAVVAAPAAATIFDAAERAGEAWGCHGFEMSSALTTVAQSNAGWRAVQCCGPIPVVTTRAVAARAIAK